MQDSEYELLYEEIEECLPELKKQFVQVNYKRFIRLSKENDDLYKQFLQLIERFSQANINIQQISNDINELKKCKESCNNKLESVKILKETQSNIDDIQIEDEITEMIDNLASYTFEKQYQQAIDTYKLLKEMLLSQKYKQILKKVDIQRQIDSTYKGLCQSLYSDYVNQSPQFDPSLIAQYLLTLNQVELLLQGYLSIQRYKFQDWIDLQNTFDEKQVQIFIGNLIRINQQFEQLFQQPLKTNQLLFSFISQLTTELTQKYFAKICPLLFEDILNFDDIFNKSKIILSYINKSKGIQLDLDIQKELSLNIEQKIIELFSIYGQKINQLIHFNQNKLIKLDYMLNLLEADKLYDEQQIDFTNSKPQEIKIKSSSTLKSTFEQMNQPMSSSSVYFWNIVFRLGDSALNFFDPKQYPILSTQLNEIISKLINMFINDYSKVIIEHSQKQQQDLSIDKCLYEIGNFFGNFNACSTLSQYLSTRASLLQFTLNHEWKTIIQVWYEELRLSMIRYFRTILLNQVVFWICDQGKIYGQNSKHQQRPSPLFLMIGFVICEIKNNLNGVIPRQPQNFFLCSLWDYIKYLLEYVLFWSYHNMGKVNEVFFLDKKNRDEIGLDMNQINLFLQSNCFKISYITQEGLTQLIYDIMFIYELYVKYVTPIQGDNFLKKLIALYCKEKKQDPNIYKIEQSEYKTIYEQYFNQKFEKDMIQAKQFIQQQRKSIIN